MNLLTPEELEAAFPLLTVFIFTLGACVGSFLNVVVWRLPHGKSLSSPPSHCPKCGHSIRAYDNIPMVSWLLLRGRCRDCQAPISMRYPIVELSTALLFLAVWWRVNAIGLPYSVLPGWFFLSAALFAVALTDIEFRVIPNKVTYTGMILAVMLAAILPRGRVLWVASEANGAAPAISGAGIAGFLFPSITESPRLAAPVDALCTLFLAWGLLMLVRALGRRFWGRESHEFAPSARLFLDARGLRIGDEPETPVDDLLWRRGQQAVAFADRATITAQDGHETTFPPGAASEPQALLKIVLAKASLRIGGREFKLKDTKAMDAKISRLQLPREVLGGGDIKLLAMIGAFTGITGVLFTLLLSSLTGLAAGLVVLFLSRGRHGNAVPYGPHLALAGVLWMLFAAEIWAVSEKILLKLV